MKHQEPAVEAAAVDGAVHIAVVKDAGSALPASSTLYAGIHGDGSGGVVKFETDGSGTITSASIEEAGSGYTYGSVILETGKVFSDAGLTAAVEHSLELQQLKLSCLHVVDMVHMQKMSSLRRE